MSQKEAQTGGITEFGRVLKQWGIGLICTNTPQARGRVEKANQTLQDRLAKEMREQEISTTKEANRYAPEFIKKFNKKFSVTPQIEKDAHRRLREEKHLGYIFSDQEIRCLSKNLSFQYKNVLYQIVSEKASYALRKAQVTVFEDVQRKVRVLYQGKELKIKIDREIENQGKVVASKEIDLALMWALKKTYKPSKNHLWK